jgi:hypothetical protein
VARHLTTQEELTLKSHFLVRPPPRPPQKGRLAGRPEPPLEEEEEDLLLFLPRSCPPELNFLFWVGHRARASEDERLSGEAGSTRRYPRDCPGLLLGMQPDEVPDFARAGRQ